MKGQLQWMLAIAGLILSVAAMAGAQDYDYNRYGYKTEVFGLVGVGSSYGEESGLSWGGGVVLRPYPRAGFEISYRQLSLDAYNSFGEGETWSLEETSRTFTASVQYYFSELRVQPYLLLGGGYVGDRSVNVYSLNLGEEIYRNNDSAFVIEAGGGVDVFVTNRLSVRPDVRLEIGTYGSIQGGINLCYHW